MPRAPLLSGRSVRSWLIRGVLLLLAAFGLLTAGLNGRWLLAEAYATYAREGFAGRTSGDAVLTAAALALRLEPGNPHYQSVLARAERLYGEETAADRLYAAALKSAPANAFLWRDYALTHALRGLEAQRAHAFARAQALAPTSRGLHMSLALAGLSDGPGSNAQLQRLWVKSVVFALKHERDPFLRYVFAARRETRLCRELQTNVSLKEWCYWIPKARQTCYRSGLKPHVVRWCERSGAYLGSRP